MMRYFDMYVACVIKLTGEGVDVSSVSLTEVTRAKPGHKMTNAPKEMTPVRGPVVVQLFEYFRPLLFDRH